MPSHRGFRIVWFRAHDGGAGPVVKEYLRQVHQPKERLKIEGVLMRVEIDGLDAPGLRVEKIHGRGAALYELKVTAFGSEHRFLAGLPGVCDPSGRPILVLLKYVKKKTRRLDRTDIETAATRLAQFGGSST